MLNPLADDLEHVLMHTCPLWEELRGRRLFITGGTGFFGCWLLESFAWACDHLDLGAEAIVLSRRPDVFNSKAPHLASHPAIRLHEGDVRSFDYPSGAFSHVIHAATESSISLCQRDPRLMLETIVDGTRRTLEFARQCGAEKYLLTSSGAVYGRQPPEMAQLDEDCPQGPDPVSPASAYGEGKRVAELLCSLYHHEFGLQTKIARCFAFVGPHLPGDRGFAIGNFLSDALGGGPIKINGDGTPYRSYLYAADLAIWLWTILFSGQPSRAYNVGSDMPYSIREIAQRVAAAFRPEPEIRTAHPIVAGVPAERYVPSIERAKRELSLSVLVDLGEALQRTLKWHNKVRGATVDLGTTAAVASPRSVPS